MSAGSPMLKLDREIESANVSLTVPYVAIPSLFMKEEGDPLSMERG